MSGDAVSKETMLQARLNSVDLSLQKETSEEQKLKKQTTREIDTQLDMIANMGPVDYKAKINLHLSMEKLKLVAQASTQGITEA